MPQRRPAALGHRTERRGSDGSVRWVVEGESVLETPVGPATPATITCRVVRPRSLPSGVTSFDFEFSRRKRIMHFSRTRIVPITASLAAGLLLGIAGPLAGKSESPVGAALNLILSGGWSWACYAFLVGYFRRSKIESALLSSFGLTIGVIAYYIYKDISPVAPVGLESGASGEGLSSRIIVWGVAAFILGAPMGLLGNLARAPGTGGLLCRLTVPLVAFYETSMRLAVEADGQGPIVGTTWHVIRFAAVAVALALVVHAVWSWWQVRRDSSWGTNEHRTGGGVTPV